MKVAHVACPIPYALNGKKTSIQHNSLKTLISCYWTANDIMHCSVYSKQLPNNHTGAAARTALWLDAASKRLPHDLSEHWLLW